jgi:hypothetical protein
VRDRRWDFLHERERQPVKRFIVERFAEHLAEALRAWPPAGVEWVSEAERRRWSAGLAARPSDDAMRFALELARLDLRRAFEEADRRLAAEGDRRWRGAAAQAAGHLLVLFLTEKCLGLKEHAAGARLSRDDLCACLELAERRLLDK